MGAFLNPLGTIHRVVGIGMMIALLAIGGWALRVDHLRADHLKTIQQIGAVLERALGEKPGSITVPKTFKAVIRLELDRNDWKDEAGTYQRERDNARGVVKAQSESILRYEAETKRLRKLSADNRALAAKLIADRDHWIVEAKKAATRTERQTCEAELAEVEGVLDALYQADF